MQAQSITERNISTEITDPVPWQLTKVKTLKDYILEVEFIDGTHGFVEMKQLIISPNAGVFASLVDINTFNQAYIQYGAVTWPNGIDLAPDAMYDEIKLHGIWILK